MLRWLYWINRRWHAWQDAQGPHVERQASWYRLEDR